MAVTGTCSKHSAIFGFMNFCLYTMHTGVDFTEQGFDSVMEYLYTARVDSATTGLVDLGKVQSVLQAAQYFSLDSLTQAVQQFVAQGISQQSAAAMGES
jgi:BTB/POZ domain